jgi:hypothetical protein
MKYLMITSFNNHWDKLYKGKTSYSDFMLKGKMNISFLKDDTPTIFIKIDYVTKQHQKAWEGAVSNFSIDTVTNKIHFNVKINKEIPLPSKFSLEHEGWFLTDSEVKDIVVSSTVKTNDPTFPPFFDSLKTTSNWKEFEDYGTMLVKLLGINEVFKFPQNDQRGRSDGFFKFRQLSVIFDFTLSTKFEAEKKQQIENYCNWLKSGYVEYDKYKFNTLNTNQQVWIITRGTNRFIKNIEGVSVKEVTIQSLIDLFIKRLSQDMLEGQLENLFINI